MDHPTITFIDVAMNDDSNHPTTTVVNMTTCIDNTVTYDNDYNPITSVIDGTTIPLALMMS